MQSKINSALETAASTGAGFLVSFLIIMYVLPWWGLKPPPGDAIEITAVFTLASLLRGYGIRRIFEFIGR